MPLGFLRTAVGTAARRASAAVPLFARGSVPAAVAPAVRGAVLAQSAAVAAATLTAAALIAAGVAAQRAAAAAAGVVLGPPAVVPMLGGTLGSLGWLASPPPDRPSLVRIGAAGSATLLVLSSAVFLVGVALSVVPPSTPALLGGYPTALSVPSMGLLRLPLERGGLGSTLVPGGLLAALARAGRLYLLPPPPARAAAAAAAASAVGGSAAAAAAAAAPPPVLLVHALVVAGLVGLRAAAAGLLILRGTDGGRLVRGVYGRRTAALAQRVTVAGLVAGVVAFDVTWPLWLLVMLVVLGGGGMTVRPTRGAAVNGGGGGGTTPATATATTSIGSTPPAASPEAASSAGGATGGGGGSAKAATGRRGLVRARGGSGGGNGNGGGGGGGTTAVQVADRPCRNECTEPSDAAAVGVYVLLLAMLGLVLPLPYTWLPFPGR